MRALFLRSISNLGLTYLLAVFGGVYAQAETTDVSFDFPIPNPQNVTISVGDSVRFIGPSGFHPLQQVTGEGSDTPTSGGFASTSSPFTVQFDQAGTFHYRCTNHGVAAADGTMRGSITVQSGPRATPVPENTPIESGCDSKPDKAVLLSPSAGKTVKGARVALDWEDDECATSYKVVVRKGKKNGSIVDQKTVTKSTYKTVKLAAKQSYFWSVKNCNENGCSSAPAFKFIR